MKVRSAVTPPPLGVCELVTTPAHGTDLARGGPGTEDCKQGREQRRLHVPPVSAPPQNYVCND